MAEGCSFIYTPENMSKHLIHLFFHRDFIKAYERIIVKNSKRAPEYSEPSFYFYHNFFNIVKRIQIIFEFIDYDVPEIRSLLEHSHHIKNKKDFLKALKILSLFLKKNGKEINTHLKFSHEEAVRLDESLEDFSNKCYYSSVVLAVSAIESRLHYLIKLRNSKIYKEYFSKFTLGQIINIFDENNYKDEKFKKIKKIFPEKYKVLLNLCNQYRIFSAHPKQEEITRNIALSILALTFQFLTDI